MNSSKSYKLPKVAIRMVKEPPLYSSQPVNRPDDAVRLVREMLESYDREACRLPSETVTRAKFSGRWGPNSAVAESQVSRSLLITL